MAHTLSSPVVVVVPVQVTAQTTAAGIRGAILTPVSLRLSVGIAVWVENRNKVPVICVEQGSHFTVAAKSSEQMIHDPEDGRGSQPLTGMDGRIKPKGWFA